MCCTLSNLIAGVGLSRWRFCYFHPMSSASSLCFTLRARPHTCIRSQRKRRNISTKTEMYVKAPQGHDFRPVHKNLFSSLVFFVHSGTATMTTTASFPAGSVADCAETSALFYDVWTVKKNLSLMALVFLVLSELQTQ